MFQRILLAWDGSETALRALDVAADIARRYDAELVAVSVAHLPAHAETAADRQESVDSAHRYLCQTLEQVRDRAERVGVTLDHQIVDGETPAGAVLEHAHTHGFDLIVCGHHHDRRVGRLLLHGIAAQLLSDSAVPVLAVPDAAR